MLCCSRTLLKFYVSIVTVSCDVYVCMYRGHSSSSVDGSSDVQLLGEGTEDACLV